MQSIGVFGDSYVDRIDYRVDLAEKALDHTRYKIFKKHIEDNIVIWYDLLENYTATDYGHGGCDQYYIYRQFLENHEKHDKVIVSSTSPHRWSFYSETIEKWIHGTNPKTCEVKSKHPKFGIKRKYYKYLQDFLIHIYSEDEMKTRIIHRLLKDSMRKIRPDVIFINGLYQWGDPKRDEDGCLRWITSYENEMLGDPERPNPNMLGLGGTPWTGMFSFNEKRKFDIRVAHMTESSHRILAKKVATALEKGSTQIKINTDEFHRTFDKEEYERYWWSEHDVVEYYENNLS